MAVKKRNEFKILISKKYEFFVYKEYDNLNGFLEYLKNILYYIFFWFYFLFYLKLFRNQQTIILIIFNWGLGIGDWGLGIGDWGLGDRKSVV